VFDTVNVGTHCSLNVASAKVHEPEEKKIGLPLSSRGNGHRKPSTLFATHAGQSSALLLGNSLTHVLSVSEELAAEVY